MIGFTLIPTEPNLIMAGNVARSTLYVKLLDILSPLFHKIVFIAGPYEYCGYTIEESDSHFRAIAASYNNVTFLQCSCTIINNQLIYGCTMWSYIPVGSGMYEQTYLSNIKEFSIKKNNNLFFKHLDWLETIVNDKIHNKLPRIMLTFHSPSLKYKEEEIGSHELLVTCASHTEYLCDYGFIWLCNSTVPQIFRN